MNRKLAGIFWGIVLIAGGAYALAQAMGYTISQDPRVWAFIFGSIAVISLIFYLLNGLRSWGWLFPVGIFGGLAFMMLLLQGGYEDPAMAASLFIGIGLPFVVAFIVDRVKNWWALIPTAVMAFLTAVVLLVDKVPGEWIGSAVLFTIALAFFLVYISRRFLWAALVAYIMFLLGFMPLLALTSVPELSGLLFFLAVGLPFLFIYLRYPDRWWAIIPAGTTLTLAVLVAITMVPGFLTQDFARNISNFIVFFGCALTFAVVWLRHHKGWAMVVTVGAALGAVAGLFVKNVEVVFPIIIILAGVLLIARNLFPKVDRT